MLLTFRNEFEHESVLSLAVSANALRVLDPAGVSKEAISASVGLLERRGCGHDSLERLFVRAGADGQPLLAAGLRPYPDGWRAHPPYLSQTQALLSDPGGALPHYPMVSHRGGYPDGS